MYYFWMYFLFYFIIKLNNNYAVFLAGKAAYSATYTTQSVRPAAQQHKAAPQYNATAYTAPVQQAPVQTTNYTYTTPVTQQPPKVS